MSFNVVNPGLLAPCWNGPDIWVGGFLLTYEAPCMLTSQTATLVVEWCTALLVKKRAGLQWAPNASQALWPPTTVCSKNRTYELETKIWLGSFRQDVQEGPTLWSAPRSFGRVSVLAWTSMTSRGAKKIQSGTCQADGSDLFLPYRSSILLGLRM